MRLRSPLSSEYVRRDLRRMGALACAMAAACLVPACAWLLGNPFDDVTEERDDDGLDAASDIRPDDGTPPDVLTAEDGSIPVDVDANDAHDGDGSDTFDGAVADAHDAP